MGIERNREAMAKDAQERVIHGGCQEQGNLSHLVQTSHTPLSHNVPNRLQHRVASRGSSPSDQCPGQCPWSENLGECRDGCMPGQCRGCSPAGKLSCSGV